MHDRETALKTASTARRSASNEASLLYWAVAITVFFVTYFSVYPKVVDLVPLNQIAFSGVVGVICGGLIAFPYYNIMKVKIADAEVQNNENLKRIKANQEAEKQVKIAKMKAQEEATK